MVKVVKKKLKTGENPFDKFANSRKKHEVLNRRVKGEDRNVGRARAKVNYIRNHRTSLIDSYLGHRRKKKQAFTGL